MSVKEALYTAEVSAMGGRSGQVKSNDGFFDMPVTMPEGMGGTGKQETNPEQLFAAAYAACFSSALKEVTKMDKDVNQDNVRVTVKVSIAEDEADGGFALSAQVLGAIPDVAREKAEEYVRKAHEVCPYSKAIRNNVPVEIGLQ